MKDNTTPLLGTGFTGRMGDNGAAFAAVAGHNLYHSMAAAGLHWPVSCRNGTCRTCIGRLTAGSVVYDMVWPGLSADEKAAGYCLPCVARPSSDLTIVPG